MPTLLKEIRVEDQMGEFAGIAEEIEERASPADAKHVWTRLQCMLGDAGLIPSDELPCSD